MFSRSNFFFVAAIVLLLLNTSFAETPCNKKYRWYEKTAFWIKNRLLPPGTFKLSQEKYESALEDYLKNIENSEWMSKHSPQNPEEKLALVEAINQNALKKPFVGVSLDKLSLRRRYLLAQALERANFDKGISVDAFEKAYMRGWEMLNPHIKASKETPFYMRYQLSHSLWSSRKRHQRNAIVPLEEYFERYGYTNDPKIVEALTAFKLRHPKVYGFGSFVAVSAALAFIPPYLENKNTADISTLVDSISSDLQHIDDDMSAEAMMKETGISLESAERIKMNDELLETRLRRVFTVIDEWRVDQNYNADKLDQAESALIDLQAESETELSKEEIFSFLNKTAK